MDEWSARAANSVCPFAAASASSFSIVRSPMRLGGVFTTRLRLTESAGFTITLRYASASLTSARS